MCGNASVYARPKDSESICLYSRWERVSLVCDGQGCHIEWHQANPTTGLVQSSSWSYNRHLQNWEGAVGQWDRKRNDRLASAGTHTLTPAAETKYQADHFLKQCWRHVRMCSLMILMSARCHVTWFRHGSFMETHGALSWTRNTIPKWWTCATKGPSSFLQSALCFTWGCQMIRLCWLYELVAKGKSFACHSCKGCSQWKIFLRSWTTFQDNNLKLLVQFNAYYLHACVQSHANM